jgi:PAS domain S-box-containing protein
LTIGADECGGSCPQLTSWALRNRGVRQLNPSAVLSPDWSRNFQVLWEDDERIFCRGDQRTDAEHSTVLVVLPVAEHPTAAVLDRFAHEYGLKDELDSAWSARPLELIRDGGRTLLVLEDSGGLPLDALMGAPMETRNFLNIATRVAVAVGKLHKCGLVHKDLKPSNILVNRTTGEVKLTGFGIASRLPRERQAPAPPEVIAGTLAYMAPEQTGRMNRSIDTRADLYALGVTLYEMLTGSLPFTASDPMEWVHCHVARRPVSPAERVKDIPTSVAAIILKLLAKTAEERYQTAAGLEEDLRRCLAGWETHGRIDDFPLGDHDTPDQLLIPEKLYGREREIATLLASFDRVVSSGRPELVLVSGHSGIGKSAVVNELHKALVPPRGLFASGKFDQYKRDIPYSTLAQAFQGLIRSLLSKSEGALNQWRNALHDALGPNGKLIVNLVPELQLIIGEPPPVPDLPLKDAQRRFQLVFRQFISVFARPEHPLALFLDDLQWLDSATLDAIENLLTQSDVRHLMLIGAYRDNEVHASHPLMRTLEAIRTSGAPVQELVLAPLTREDLAQLTRDALHCKPGRATALAELIHEKTAGNPFFAIQFIAALVEEGFLTFDYGEGRWSWDLNRMHAKGYTENVVDLMVGKLNRLPVDTQEALQRLACLGHSAAIATLALVHGTSEEEVHAHLSQAVHNALIERLENVYRFIHDRVQEAAYSLIPEERRAQAHLRIGRLLAAHTPPEKREEAIFEIVNQLNRGAALITARDEREHLAELNLSAGKRAKASTAYASALSYLVAGVASLADDGWVRRPELMFALEMHRAECEFLTGALAAAEARLTMLASRAATTIEQATVACLRIDLYMTLDRSDRAVDVGLTYLRHLGVEWSPHPTEEEVRREWERTWALLGSREIEELIDLPVMSDPVSLATLDVLTKVANPALYTDANLCSLAICRAVNLSLEHGNTDASCYGYVTLGAAVAGPRFGDYAAGFRFGRLAYDLVDQRGLQRFKARTYVMFGNLVMPWTKHVRTGRDLVRRAFDAANATGDLPFATLSCSNLITNLLAAGDPLVDVQREAEEGLEFAEKARFGLVVDRFAVQLGLIRTLRGLTPIFGCFNDERFDELRVERRLSSNPMLALPECWYWIRKLQARFFAGDYVSAVEASVAAQRLLWTSPSFFETAEAHFYGALSHAASCDAALPAQYRQHVQALTAHHRQLLAWAKHGPENFANRASLVGAEIARIEGRELDAERLYEEAIRSARENGFVHNEALANELAARFYATRGFQTIAHAYLRNARYGYLRWGADGKVRQLDALHPHLHHAEPAPDARGTIGTPIEHLELATVLNVSQAISGELVLDKLVETLLRTAIEQAGAERGLLILPRGVEPRIAAEASTGGDAVTVHPRDQPVSAALLPESVLHYVLRMRESIILDDATAQSLFAADPYIRQRQARSILCLPLLSQTKLIGVLYLENNLSPRVFAPARIAVLKLVASQAAIALENAHLYRDVAARETKIRRLVDSNIIGIFIWDLDGRIIEANDEFLRMVNYDREDLAAGRVSWLDLTPRDWRDGNAQRVDEVRITGTAQPYEKEYLRKDGSRVPVLVGAASFEETGNQGVAFVLDLTERKHAEEALRQLESDLAHINRVSMMGELAASLSHEILHPLATARNNARVGMRFLEMNPPNLDEAREALDCVVRDADRAKHIVGRIRSQIKRAPPRNERFDLNEAINEVIVMVRSAIAKNGISVSTRLMDGLAPVQGDRVQLQQVLVNLILNAIEAMSSIEDGPRELSLRTEQSQTGGILVAVRDSGPGIDPASLERVFEPFYTTKASGVGMGLSICRTIINGHGGRLWMSANEPRGTIFQFTLPTVKADS